VIGKNVAEEPYKKRCPVGETIFLFNAPYRIVGVMEPKGTDASGKNLDDMVFIPITSAVKRISNVDYIDGMYILPISESKMKEAMEEAESLLLKLHGKKDFTVSAYEDLINVQKQAMDIFTILSITVAVIAFSVGGLGILAVMTLSVYERLIEIGIRRAFGARKRDIFKQFLIESALLSLSGSAVGVVLATALVIVISKFAHWQPIYFPLKGVIISSSLSIGIGLIAGIYPAMRATSFEPKEILREV
jgi:putative ABC transport system permease protein